MKKLYLRCDLVHADLSEYNLLYHNNKIWVIDVSQSLLKDHPQALRFLLRDCYNITKVAFCLLCIKLIIKVLAVFQEKRTP